MFQVASGAPEAVGGSAECNLCKDAALDGSRWQETARFEVIPVTGQSVEVQSKAELNEREAGAGDFLIAQLELGPERAHEGEVGVE